MGWRCVRYGVTATIAVYRLKQTIRRISTPLILDNVMFMNRSHYGVKAWPMIDSSSSSHPGFAISFPLIGIPGLITTE